jgi:hypothetical protein
MNDARKVAQIKEAIKVAEKWNDMRMMPTSLIAVTTFRAIRRIVNRKD